MAGVTNGSKKLGVPVCAPDIFGGTCAAPRNTSWIRLTVGRQQILELHRVFPVIPKVVTIPGRLRSVRKVSRDWNLPSWEARTFVWHLVLGKSDTRLLAGLGVDGEEFVKVIVLPTHRILNRNVQIPEGITLWHLDPPPHQRVALRKDDEELAHVTSLRLAPLPGDHSGLVLVLSNYFVNGPASVASLVPEIHADAAARSQKSLSARIVARVRDAPVWSPWGIHCSGPGAVRCYARLCP